MTVSDTAFVRSTRSHERARASLFARLLRRVDARAVRDHLHALPDHLLQDIGLERDQVDVAAGRLTRSFR